MPKSTRRASLQAMQKNTNLTNPGSDVRLLMECTEEELLPCQKMSYSIALNEFTKIKNYIENVRSGKTPMVPLPNSQISSINAPVENVSNDPDVIVVGESPPKSKQSSTVVSSTPATVTTIPSLPDNLRLQSDQSVLAVPQQVYKFVNGQQSNVIKVGNQIFIRPMMSVAPQQNAPVLNMNQFPKIPAQNIIRPTGGLKRLPDMESSKKLNKKEVDSSGNWVPLDEFYYGKKEGDPTYVEEKGEYRFKCWYCMKMLYNNVKAMMHMQGHIDSEKQQNLDLSDLTQCKHCYKQFDTPFEMQTHIEKVHLNNSNVLMCRICEKDHESRVALTSHMRQNHNACEMPYICQLCGFRSSMYSDVVDHFKKKHDSSENLLCLYCLRAFKVKFVSSGWGQTQNYYHHLLKHQGKNRIRKCQVCKLNFFNPQDLKAHRKKDHQPNVKGVIGMNSKYTTPDQVMIKVPDQGLQPKPIKSLNAPAVSKVRDNHLNLPQLVNQVHCFECKMLMGTQDHYKKYIQCSMCRFATSCSFAYANHMMGFHSGQMTPLSLDIPKERPMEHVMYCMCGYASKYGNNIANHMVYCTKRTCYKDKPDIAVQEYDNKDIQDPRNKPGASLLDVLGLVKKPMSSLVQDDEECIDEDIAAKPSHGQEKKSDWFRIKLQQNTMKDNCNNTSNKDDIDKGDVKNEEECMDDDSIDEKKDENIMEIDNNIDEQDAHDTDEVNSDTIMKQSMGPINEEESMFTENQDEGMKVDDILESKQEDHTDYTAESDSAISTDKGEDSAMLNTSKKDNNCSISHSGDNNDSLLQPISIEDSSTIESNNISDSNIDFATSECDSQKIKIDIYCDKTENVDYSSPRDNLHDEIEESDNHSSCRNPNSETIDFCFEKVSKNQRGKEGNDKELLKIDSDVTDEQTISESDSHYVENQSKVETLTSDTNLKEVSSTEERSKFKTNMTKEINNSDKTVASGEDDLNIQEQEKNNAMHTISESVVEQENTDRMGNKISKQSEVKKDDIKEPVTLVPKSEPSEFTKVTQRTLPSPQSINNQNRQHSLDNSDRYRDHRDKDRPFVRRSDEYGRDRDRSRGYHYERDRTYDHNYDRRGRDRRHDTRDYGFYGNMSIRDRRDGYRDRDWDRNRDYYNNRNHGARSGRGHYGNYRDRNNYH